MGKRKSETWYLITVGTDNRVYLFQRPLARIRFQKLWETWMGPPLVTGAHAFEDRQFMGLVNVVEDPQRLKPALAGLTAAIKEWRPQARWSAIQSKRVQEDQIMAVKNHLRKVAAGKNGRLPQIDEEEED
jgi:hypothetical protein